MTDPPLISLVATSAARRSGAGAINWLQDLYPEVAVALGVPPIRGPLAAGLAKLRDRSLCAAEANVAVGTLMRQKMENRGVSPARIHVIANWCNDEDIKPAAPADNPLRVAWGLEGRFVFGYSGNLGRAHEFDTVLGAAALLRGDTRYVFLMIGGGKLFDELRSAAMHRGLADSFRFQPYQDRAALTHSLGVCDAHWVSLSPNLEGLIVPSKFYGIAAAGRPIVVIGDANGELSQLVRRYECGDGVAAGDCDALVRILSNLADEPAVAAAMGLRARKMLEEKFTRRHAFQRWSALLHELDRFAPIGGGQLTT